MKVKLWALITNGTFIVSLIILALLLNDDSLSYGLLGNHFFLLAVLILLFSSLAIVGGIAAIVLNGLYIPEAMRVQASKSSLRFFVIALNTIVFLGLAYGIINLLSVFTYSLF
jgi:hypothetical protein